MRTGRSIILNFCSRLRHKCSERERRAEEAEREVVKLKKAEYMRDHIGEEFDGVISGVTKWGAYVEFGKYGGRTCTCGGYVG